MVDNGCTVVDVIVEHPFTASSPAPCSFPADTMWPSSSPGATPPSLSVLTGGIHLHTLLCPSEDAYRRVLDALRQAGFLLEG